MTPCPEPTERIIAAPFLHVVLYQPEIPPNTGNVARLCGAARVPLHLVHPLGFRVDDRHLKRAGLDYWDAVDIRHHGSFEAFLEDKGPLGSIVGFSVHGERPYTEGLVSRGDYLLFGPETRGLPASLRERFPMCRIPIWGEVRSLNLATSVGIVLYHWLHTLGRF